MLNSYLVRLKQPVLYNCCAKTKRRKNGDTCKIYKLMDTIGGLPINWIIKDSTLLKEKKYIPKLFHQMLYFRNIFY